MKTIKKEFKEYVLSRIDYDYLKECDYNSLSDCIKSETNKSKLTIKIIQDWLQGLPSAVDLLCYPFHYLALFPEYENLDSDYWRDAAIVVFEHTQNIQIETN